MSETGSQDQPDDAMVDLLVKQVTEGLSPAEQRALDVLDSALASEHLREFERAAAAITLAAPVQALPPSLRARLEEQAQIHAASATHVRSLRPTGTAAAKARRVSRSGAAGWFAAAACLLLALFGWFRSPPSSVAPTADIHVTVPPATMPPVPAPKEPPTAAEERATLLAKTESRKITLGATKDPAAAGVTGDVVWDPATQKGFLHFVGLAPNDPQVHQYQLWIFDGGRDKRYPVDGGVFNVPANSGEVVIPIHAELPIVKLAAFAVTIEKPGGVVVSSRDHVIVLGTAG
ncbi:MAG: anti-sigma factor domain-containing protein [Steroidobacteraceae bacterium]